MVESLCDVGPALEEREHECVFAAGIDEHCLSGCRLEEVSRPAREPELAALEHALVQPGLVMSRAFGNRVAQGLAVAAPWKCVDAVLRHSDGKVGADGPVSARHGFGLSGAGIQPERAKLNGEIVAKKSIDR